MTKKNVLVIYGAESVEHDISIITALQTMSNFNKDVYNMIPLYIGRDGVWYVADNLDDKKVYLDFKKNTKNLRTVVLEAGTSELYIKKKGKVKDKIKIDFALLCTHGRIGEDGALQGMLECAHIPYSSSNVKSCAIAMDKIFMKDIFVARDIPNILSIGIDYDIFKTQANKLTSMIEKKLKFPVIIKPANLGSSIGIKICKSKADFLQNIEYCAQFDRRLLIEKFVESFDEYNCAGIKMNGEIKTSAVQKVTNKEEIFSFEDKYIKDKPHENERVERGLVTKIKALTQKVYEIFDCSGVVRVDFIYDRKTGGLYVNELNSIPGSLAFYLFKDFSYKDIVSCLIEESLSKKKSEKFITAFESKALEVFDKLDFAKK